MKLSNSLKLNLEEFEYLTINEVKDLVKSKSNKKYKKLIRRRKFCIFGIIKGKKVLITKSNDVKIIAKHLEPKVIKNKVIIGKVANKGLVKGKVRLISQLNHKEMLRKAKLLKRGEILVTGMTQPEIIFACKKASAIITDEGGITLYYRD